MCVHHCHGEGSSQRPRRFRVPFLDLSTWGHLPTIPRRVRSQASGDVGDKWLGLGCFASPRALLGGSVTQSAEGWEGVFPAGLEQSDPGGCGGGEGSRPGPQGRASALRTGANLSHSSKGHTGHSGQLEAASHRACRGGPAAARGCPPTACFQSTVPSARGPADFRHRPSASTRLSSPRSPSRALRDLRPPPCSPREGEGLEPSGAAPTN